MLHVKQWCNTSSDSHTLLHFQTRKSMLTDPSITFFISATLKWTWRSCSHSSLLILTWSSSRYLFLKVMLVLIIKQQWTTPCFFHFPCTEVGQGRILWLTYLQTSCSEFLIKLHTMYFLFETWLIQPGSYLNNIYFDFHHIIFILKYHELFLLIFCL